MRAVGIKVLKAKLSEYIRLAKTGETILVTERDEVVAELRPAKRQPLGTGTLTDHLTSLADRGEATLRSEDPKDWSGLKPRLRSARVSSGTLLDAVREESR